MVSSAIWDQYHEWMARVSAIMPITSAINPKLHEKHTQITFVEVEPVVY